MGSIRRHKRVESQIDNIFFDTVCHTDRPQFFTKPYDRGHEMFGKNGTLELDFCNVFKDPERIWVRDDSVDFKGVEHF